MSTIVLMVPTSGSSGGSSFVQGETNLSGFENMMQVDSVEWHTDVEKVESTSYQRTLALPKVSEVTITRKVDGASAVMTKWALQALIGQSAWELYFFKAMGDALPTGSSGSPQSSPNMNFQFMTLKLYNPLITKLGYQFSDTDCVETLEVTPSKIEWIYFMTDSGQNMIGQTSVLYDVQAGSFV